MKRSILTEKVARRGFHLSREYAVDPLEILFVREVMRTNSPVQILPGDHFALADEPLRAVVYRMAESGVTKFTVLDDDQSRKPAGIVARQQLLKRARPPP